MAENSIEKQEMQDVVVPEPQKEQGKVITVVLTADNHLGYTAFGQQPRKREERQQRVRRAFQQATDFAIAQGVDLFIQAGDLFDTTTPDERDRSFVATRLAQLKQAGVRAFALGGVHDTPGDTRTDAEESTPAPQISFARLGALHYFPPVQKNESNELEPVLFTIRGKRVGICGLGVLAGQEGDPLAKLRVQSDIEGAAISILVLHAPIEGLVLGSSLLDTRALVARGSIASQTAFKFIFAGYHHAHQHFRVGQTEVIVAGATQHVDFSAPDREPGFVFMGIDAEGVRWCNHIPVDALLLLRLTINVQELWVEQASAQQSPTAIILERLRPLCGPDAMIQVRLEGQLTRGQYHQLDLNQIRRYGEEHCFALAIDDSALSLLTEQDTATVETGERLSPREELVTLVNEWIENASNEQEKKALVATREELLLAMDEMKSRR
jgi:DNA repair exonuclease SbcCD nuclease subunit